VSWQSAWRGRTQSSCLRRLQTSSHNADPTQNGVASNTCCYGCQPLDRTHDLGFCAMPDPLTVLGVVSSIAQLVDFSAKTVSLALLISAKGSTALVSSLKTATDDLRELGETIHRRTRSTLGKAACLTSEEKVCHQSTAICSRGSHIACCDDYISMHKLNLLLPERLTPTDLNVLGF
jgi:hypothetical protein